MRFALIGMTALAASMLSPTPGWSQTMPAPAPAPQGGGRPNPPMYQQGQTQREADAFAGAKIVGTPRDTVDAYFAMRRISVGRGPVGNRLALHLNNKPLFHNGTLDQGRWPESLLTPPSEEAMIYDMEFLQKAGFNMLRKHIKVEPAQYYAAADRMGMHLWFPDRVDRLYQAAKTPEDYLARYTQKMGEVVRQKQNGGLAASVYTETTDVEGELNGLLTYDRAVIKIPAETLAEIAAPLTKD